MKFKINSLKLDLTNGDEFIPFGDTTYFWGQMGAGKSSIVRLVDFCLGGKITLSPALQSEFVSARLEVELSSGPLTIERPRDSSDVIASWDRRDGPYKVILPARPISGMIEVIPDTGVENLSDLIFWLSNIRPPRIRKSKTKADSQTVRLSIRDLLWYCYLDQDHLDSDFFYLDDDAEFYMRLKSRDVIRYVIGYHDEKIADLEAELDQLRANRNARSASIASLTRTFVEVGVDSEEQMQARLDELDRTIEITDRNISVIRAAPRDKQTVHALDDLRSETRALSEEIAAMDNEQQELIEVKERNIRHRNEIETLGLKFKRSSAAREILGDLRFEHCPRCAQGLPQPNPGCCSVCGQEDRSELPSSSDEAALQLDILGRRKELDEVISEITSGIAVILARRATLLKAKNIAESNLNKAAAEQDSAFLSMVLKLERERATLEETRQNTKWLMRLPLMLREHREALAEVIAFEEATRAKLKEERERAEEDRTAIDKFASYFLDCLVRAGVPGIRKNDRVVLDPPKFYPQVYSNDVRDQTASTFSSLSSGGKKTLFKCCFAIAFHRIAEELHAPLPEVLIIDSPMKNISERENKEQFEGFYSMIYELKASEFESTQVILVDKEFFEPPIDLPIDVDSRHMRPDDAEFPPLIKYYRGK